MEIDMTETKENMLKIKENLKSIEVNLDNLHKVVELHQDFIKGLMEKVNEIRETLEESNDAKNEKEINEKNVR